MTHARSIRTEIRTNGRDTRHGRRIRARGGTAYAADSKSAISRFESGRAYFGNFFELCLSALDRLQSFAIFPLSQLATTNRG